MSLVFLFFTGWFIFCSGLSLNAVTANESTFKNKFVMLNKTYIGDLDSAVTLYKTIDRHYKGSDLFYIATPKSDQDIFVRVFQELLKNHEIKKMPVFITDEYIISKCDLGLKNPQIDLTRFRYPCDMHHFRNDICSLIISEKGDNIDSKGYLNVFNATERNPRVLKMHGWYEQQLVKLCFSKTKLAKHYVTFDSDIIIVKDFDTSIFYSKEGNLKTLSSPYRPAGIYHDNIFRLLKINNQSEKETFMSSYGIYNSILMDKMLEYTQQLEPSLKTFYDLIVAAPWEIQWISQYIRSFHQNEWTPMEYVDFVIDPANIYEMCEFISEQLHSVEYLQNNIVFVAFQHKKQHLYSIDNLANLDDYGKYLDYICRHNYSYKVRLLYGFLDLYNNIKCKLKVCHITNRALILNYYDKPTIIQRLLHSHYWTLSGNRK